MLTQLGHKLTRWKKCQQFCRDHGFLAARVADSSGYQELPGGPGTPLDVSAPSYFFTKASNESKSDDPM